ncbi:MAG TPA: HEAT repeat domain-containing protein, partial [Planctomycetota bacterium]|nr:HEAT repeat domain-containing protein [Planctomycetota bacterium]
MPLLIVVLGGVALAELGSAEWRKAAERAEIAQRKGDEREAADACLEVAKDDSERAVKLIAQTFAKFPGAQEDLFDKVFEALAGVKSPGGVAEMRKELSSARDWRLRVLLVDVLGGRGKAEQDALIGALGDRQEEVVRGATRQLARLRTETGLVALCDAMAKLESKGKTAATWQDMRNALMRALGVDLQGGADYKNYLEANKERFVEGRGIP